MKKAIAAMLVAGSLLVAAPAQASPYSYTRNHCISFARAMTDGRYQAAARQVVYLAVSPSIQPVRGAAVRLYYNHTTRNYKGLVNACYSIVVV